MPYRTLPKFSLVVRDRVVEVGFHNKDEVGTSYMTSSRNRVIDAVLIPWYIEMVQIDNLYKTN